MCDAEDGAIRRDENRILPERRGRTPLRVTVMVEAPGIGDWKKSHANELSSATTIWAGSFSPDVSVAKKLLLVSQAGGRGREADVGSKQAGEDGGGGSGECAVAGDVFGEWRRDEERDPSWVGHRGVIAVGVCLADGGDRTSELGRVFGVPIHDRCIGQHDVELRVVGHAVALLASGCLTAIQRPSALDAPPFCAAVLGGDAQSFTNGAWLRTHLARRGGMFS